MNKEQEIIERRVDALIVDSIKQSLITEYLKKNPRIKREEVIAKSINGEWVIDNINSILQDIFKRKDINDSFHQATVFEDLKSDSEKRYKACQVSIGNSKKVIDFLFHSAYASFGLKEKNENITYLSQQERLCAEAIVQYYTNIKAILKLMYEKQPAFIQLKSSVLDYFDSLQKQMRYQYNIFDREIALNNEFSQYSKNLIQDHMKNLQTKIKDTEKKKLLLNQVAKAYLILKANGFLKIEDASSVSIELFNQVLQDFDVVMTKKRGQLEAVQKVIKALEKVVEYLEISLGNMKSGKTKEPPPTNNSSRMAFRDRVSNIVSRVKTAFRRNASN
jgi:hypothetical protein